MRLVTASVLGSIGLMLAAAANAATPYVAVGIGVGGVQPLNGRVRVGSVDVGGFRGGTGTEISGEVAAGAYFGRRFAAEIALRYGRADLRSAIIAGQPTLLESEIGTLTVLARSRFVLIPRGKVRPFIGGGIGVQRVEVGGIERTGFAYEGMGGVTVPLGRRWELDATARYTGSTSAALDAGGGVSVDGLHYRTLLGSLSLRYIFR
jgi:Outer membrane protein beta-barrel domain